MQDENAIHVIFSPFQNVFFFLIKVFTASRAQGPTRPPSEECKLQVSVGC